MTGQLRPLVLIAGLLLVPFVGCAGSRQKAAVDAWRAAAPRPADASEGQIAAVVDTTATLDDYLTLARANNLALESARQEWKAALEKAPQAGALPDPVLTYGNFLEEVETRVGPQKQRLGINQAVPWFGTLGQRKSAALAGADAARQRYEMQRAKLEQQVQIAYADLYLLGASVEITRENLELLTFWEKILNARYATGRAGYHDLVRVQVDLGRLEDRLTALEEQRKPKTARLNSLLNLPQETLLPWPRSLPDDLDLPATAVIEDAVRERNPELAALRAMVEMEQEKVGLSRKAGYPDFRLGVDWIQTDERDVVGLDDNGKDPVVAHVGLRLPLWRGRINAGKREAEASLGAAVDRLADRENGIASELSDLLFRHADADRKIALYRDSLIPKGRQALDAAFSAFETGEADFLTVLDSQRALLEFELSLEGARADRLRARAGIDAMTGRPADREVQ